MMNRLHRRVLPVALAVCIGAAGAVWAVQQRVQRPAEDSFAELITRLSEPGGYFDTDNLISNEKSYLHVFPELAQHGTRGGVYIGVGPDQNFSYIAGIRPSIAFLIDIRRDNLLLHLLFKAIFAESTTRAEYLCMLTGRPLPGDIAEWREVDIERLVDYIDSKKPAEAVRWRARLGERIRSFGVRLSADDIQTIERYHATFADSGLSLQFKTFGRPVQSYNPTLRELLLETDLAGGQRSFLASEGDFQFVKSMQREDKIIPVVGDLAGDHALHAIGEWMAEHDEELAAFYVSNVEDYLYRDRRILRFIENLQGLPRNDRSVIIRSVFGRVARPLVVEGYYTATMAQPVTDLVKEFAAGRYRNYYDLVGP